MIKLLIIAGASLAPFAALIYFISRTEVGCSVDLEKDTQICYMRDIPTNFYYTWEEISLSEENS